MDGIQLKTAREAKGWSLREAAKHLGVDHNTLHNWERGKASPRGYNRQKIEEVYGISLAPVSCVVASLVQVPSFVSTDLTMRLQAILFTEFKNFQDTEEKLQAILEEFDAMPSKDSISRRDAIRRAVTLPFILSSTSKHKEEIINYCATSIAGCWELSKSKNGEDLVLSFDSASFNIFLLESILKNCDNCKQAVELIAQASMIKTFLGWHLESARDATQYAKLAIEYSKRTNDIPLQISAWKYLAWAYIYDPSKQQQALHAMNQAVLIAKQNKKNVPMALHGNVFSALAYMQSRNHLSSVVSLREAEKAVPYSGDDGIYCDSSLPLLQMYSMMSLYAAGDYRTAQPIANSLMDLETLKMKVSFSERRRIEILNSISAAYLKQPDKDMEKAIHFWQAGVEGARALQSEQRFQEGVTSYTVLAALWPNEKRVIALRPLITHW